MLDEALFTAPAHPNWGGAALVGLDGRLLGVGSLLVQTVSSNGEQSGANMIVPIDLLKPILDDMKTYGRPNRPARPWLGFLVQDVGDHLVVASVYEGCPADRAGVEVGDLVVEVAGEPIDGLAELFRKVWGHRAGRERDSSYHRPGRRAAPGGAGIDRSGRAPEARRRPLTGTPRPARAGNQRTAAPNNRRTAAAAAAAPSIPRRFQLKFRDSKCLNQAMDSRFRGNDDQPESNASR